MTSLIGSQRLGVVSPDADVRRHKLVSVARSLIDDRQQQATRDEPGLLDTMAARGPVDEQGEQQSTLPTMTLAQLDAVLATVVLPEQDSAQMAAVDAGEIVIVDLTDLTEVTAVEAELHYVQADDIEAAFYQSKVEYLVSGLDLRETTILLLKTGLAYVGLRTSPLDLLIPAEPARSSGAWTRWRLDESGRYEISAGEHEPWRVLAGTRIDTCPADPIDIAGNYLRTTADRYGGISITRWDNAIFGDDGRFARRSSRLTTVQGDIMNPFGLTTSYREAPLDRGTYTLLGDGLTIEIHHDDGLRSRLLFYRLGDAVVLGDHSFSLTSRQPGTDGSSPSSGSRGNTDSWLALLAELDEESRRKKEDEQQQVRGTDCRPRQVSGLPNTQNVPDSTQVPRSVFAHTGDSRSTVL